MLIVVGRDTDAYPTQGAFVTVTVHDPDPARDREAYIKRETDVPPIEAQQPGESRADWKNRTFGLHYGAGPDIGARARAEDPYQQVAYLEGRLEAAHAQIAELDAQLNATHPIQNEPYLGLATTEQMFRELIARCRALPIFTFDRAITLAEMLGGMSASEREYRTVDGD